MYRHNLSLSPRWPLKQVARRLFEPELADTYVDLVEYLPLRRRVEFMRAWVLNHFVLGPRKRERIRSELGRVAPAMLNVSVTYRCNLHCRGCYASAYERGIEMSADQLDAVVREAKSLGITFIGLLGGEPLLRKEILPVLKRHPDMAFRISTNGTLVDDGVVAFLRKTGNTVLFFSVEGGKEQTDWWRGDGVYRRIREAMDRLRCERVLFGFSAALHARNKDFVGSEAFLEEMRDAGARIGLFFPYGPVGARQMFDLVLSRSERSEIYFRLRALQQRYRIVLSMEDEPTCTAGTTLHITPEGNVEPCNAIQFHTANVFTTGLRQVLDAPFYKEVAACTACHESCLAIEHPGEVLRLVHVCAARESNPKSLLSAHRYVAYRSSERGACRRAYALKEELL